MALIWVLRMVLELEDNLNGCKIYPSVMTLDTFVEDVIIRQNRQESQLLTTFKKNSSRPNNKRSRQPRI